jgi:hypothetical protein
MCRSGFKAFNLVRVLGGAKVTFAEYILISRIAPTPEQGLWDVLKPLQKTGGI